MKRRGSRGEIFSSLTGSTADPPSVGSDRKSREGSRGGDEDNAKEESRRWLCSRDWVREDDRNIVGDDKGAMSAEEGR